MKVGYCCLLYQPSHCFSTAANGIGIIYDAEQLEMLSDVDATYASNDFDEENLEEFKQSPGKLEA